MSISVTLNLADMKAAAAAFEAFLKDARTEEGKAIIARDQAQQAVDAVTSKVKVYTELLKKVNLQLEEETEENEDDTLLTAFRTIRRNRLNIDAKTLQILEESGASKTSDEIFALVAASYEVSISDKSVKNALGQFVKDGKIIKRYSKEKQAYLYGFSEAFDESMLNNEELGLNPSESQNSEPGTEQLNALPIDFNKKESATA